MVGQWSDEMWKENTSRTHIHSTQAHGHTVVCKSICVRHQWLFEFVTSIYSLLTTTILHSPFWKRIKIEKTIDTRSLVNVSLIALLLAHVFVCAWTSRPYSRTHDYTFARFIFILPSVFTLYSRCFHVFLIVQQHVADKHRHTHLPIPHNPYIRLRSKSSAVQRWFA